jgi:hypothetical protein
MIKVAISAVAGVITTLLSTFVGTRSATATYPDIMGCEESCQVAATGWPLIFVRDYLGMSVVNTADILEIWFAADQFAWTPFLLNLVFWSGLAFAALRIILRRSGNKARAGKRTKP